MDRSKILSIPLAISVIILLIGYVSRVQHWANGAIIERVAFATIAVLYTVRFSLKQKRNLKDVVKLMLIVSWSVTSILAPLRMPNVYILQILVAATGVFWLILEIMDLVKRNVATSNTILFLGALLLVAEAIFRVQWWPGGSMLHLLALLVISIGFVIDFAQTRKTEST